MDHDTVHSAPISAFVDTVWEQSIVPTLQRYIEIPNKSPMFDGQWQEHGFMDQAVELATQWCREHAIEGMTMEVIRLPQRTPLLFIDVPAYRCGDGDAVLLYGHLDKQPEMTGWDQGLGPWQAVLRDDKLYGRGGADDGYAVFASLTALSALRSQQISHRRAVIIIECCEESGSYDLPYYIDALRDRIGQPNLVVCLDSGCGNYSQMWLTTSLRGIIGGHLSVEILREGVHSGDASGVVPCSFRIARQLLNRIEEVDSGAIKVPEFHADIPEQREQQAAFAAQLLQQDVAQRFPFVQDARPSCDNVQELILRRTWHPTLVVTGAAGLPAIGSAGNVLRPVTGLKLSLRLPPTVDAEMASRRLKEILEEEPPYGARVRFVAEGAASGWHAPAMQAWLEQAIQNASQQYFGAAAVQMGEGGSIPFMGMLGEKFPAAQFVITGVLGPKSNAHGPNEFLHIPTAKKLTCCVAHIIMEHGLRA